MKAIRLTQNEVDLITTNSIKIFIRQDKFDETFGQDYILYPDSDNSQIFSPGSIYIYKILDIAGEGMLEELGPLHGYNSDNFNNHFKYPAYGYVFRFRPFNEPVVIEPQDGKDFIFNLEIKTDPHHSVQLIDPYNYDPRKIDDIQLLDDWRILESWYKVWKKTGKHPKYSREDIENTAQIILREILKRGMRFKLPEEGTPEAELLDRAVSRIKNKDIFSEYYDVDFIETEDNVIVRRGSKWCIRKEGSDSILPGSCHTDKSETEKMLRAINISKSLNSESDWECECLECGHIIKTDKHCEDIKCPECGGKMRRDDRPGIGQYAHVNRGGLSKGLNHIQLEEVLSTLKPFKITKPLAYLVGGIVTHGFTEGDIDVLINQRKPNLPLEFRIYRQFPKEWWPRFHFHYNNKQDYFGPFTDYVPVYDLQTSLSTMKVEHMEADFTFETDDFVSYPFAYLGSKRKIIKTILETIPSDVRFMVDGFSGSGVVSYFSKKIGLDVVGVDVSKIGQVIHSAVVSNNTTTLSDNDLNVLLSAKPENGHMTNLSLSNINFTPSCKKYMDGYRKVADSMPSPKREIAKAVMLSVAGSMCFGGGLRDGIHQRVYARMKKENTSMLNIMKSGIRKWTAMYNKFITDKGGKSRFVRSDISNFLKSISELPDGQSILYLDPPYVSETGNTKDYYKRYDYWEHVVFGNAENLKLSGNWTPDNFYDRLGKVLEPAKSKFNYVLLSYKTSKTVPRGKLTRFLKKFFSNIKIKKIPYKYIFPKPKMHSGEEELLFLMSNQSLSNLKFRTAEGFDNFCRDEISEAHFLTPTRQSEAAKSKSEDKIEPGRFFWQAKGIKGYKRLEAYDIDSVVETIGSEYPVEVDQKYDGLSAQLHKVGSKVRLYSDDGGDLTHRFPTAVEEALRIPEDFVVIGEITGTTDKGKHMGRQFVSGYAHSKGDPDDSPFKMNIYDTVYWSDKDIHTKDLSSRRTFLERGFSPYYEDIEGFTVDEGDVDDSGIQKVIDKSKQSKKIEMKEHPLRFRPDNMQDFAKKGKFEFLNVIPIMIAKNSGELRKAINTQRKVKGSEGAVIKVLSSTYPLSGLTRKWVKFKNTAFLDCQIIKVKETETKGTFNYLCGVSSDSGDKIIPVGWTYNVTISKAISPPRVLRKGDIIRVEFVNLNKYLDPDTDDIWFNWFNPRFLEWRDDLDVPNTVKLADRLNKETKSEDTEKKMPQEYREAVSDFEFDMEDFTDPYLTYPEVEKPQFVLQAHIRGRSIHLDDRRQVTKSWGVGMTHDIGFTKFSDTEHENFQLSREPKNFTDAKNLFYKEIWPELKKSLTDPRKKFLSQKKALVPLEWWDKEGYIPVEEPGATKHNPGYLINLDKGEVESLTLKPHFHEYVYHGRILKGKYVDRLLKNVWSDKTGKSKMVWFFFPTNNPPYVLTARAEKVGWVPPYNISALPKSVEKKVPEGFRYWKHEDESERLKIRNRLRKEMRGKIENLELPNITPPIDTYFTLQKQTWRGTEIVRAGPSRTIFYFNILLGGKVFSYATERNPVETKTASVMEDRNLKYVRIDGDVKPGHPLNPTKDTPSHISLLDEGMGEILSLHPDFMKIRMKGKSVKGIYNFKQEKGTQIWTVSRDSYEEHDFSIEHMDFVIKKSSMREDGSLRIEKGFLFRQGEHKGKTYRREVVQNAVLEPIHRGTNLAYINFFHNREESSRGGIMTNIWWDDNEKWYCELDNEWKKGALMFDGVVTDKDAITAINNGTYQISAEVAFSSDENGDPDWLAICGAAICHSPAVSNAQIQVACQGDKCKTFPKGILPKTL